jgi:hypothetical protein
MKQNQNARVARAVQMLTVQLDAAKVLSSGPAYDEARRVWNAAVTRCPGVIIPCECIGDVQSSVQPATTCGLPLSVRDGGHDSASGRRKSDMILIAHPEDGRRSKFPRFLRSYCWVGVVAKLLSSGIFAGASAGRRTGTPCVCVSHSDRHTRANIAVTHADRRCNHFQTHSRRVMQSRVIARPSDRRNRRTHGS